MVGFPDQIVFVIKMKLAIDLDEVVTRTNWLWDKVDWGGMKAALDGTVWSDVLLRDVSTQVIYFTKTLLACREIHIRLDMQVEDRMVWILLQETVVRYKSHPTVKNKRLHNLACKNMKKVQKEAISSWKEHLKNKLIGRSAGNKKWVISIKQ